MLNCIIGETLTLSTFLICSAVSLALGAGTAMLMKIKNKPSAGFFISLVILPLVVQAVIMLVNGNIGAGVAVAGAFGLVRFRSAQGSAREITAIFIDMAIGLATGMGYIGVAAILFVIVAAVYIVLMFFVFARTIEKRRILKIAIPEDYDYDNLFDEVFIKHGVKAELTKVKTTNMGTLYELKYELTPSVPLKKGFLDDIRAKNANLSVTLTSAEDEEGL